MTLMKKAILCLALALSHAGPTMATIPQEVHGRCALMGSTAEMIMHFRQEGGEMSAAMRIFSGDPLSDLMVRQAYQESRYHTQPSKQFMIDEFRDTWTSTCYETILK